MKGDSSEEEEEYKNKKSNSNVRKILFIFSLFILLFLLAGISASVGSYPITVTEVYSIIWHSLFQNAETTSEIVVWNLRLPRILMGILAGVGLAIAGTMMQGILRNPLASPLTLGIASGAGFGAFIAVILGASFIPIVGGYIIIGTAFLFAFIISLLILYLANRIGATPFGVVVIVVAGIAIMWLFAPVRSLLLYFGEVVPVKEVMVGSLGRASWDNLLPTSVMLVVCCILLFISLPFLKLLDFDTISIRVKPENSLSVEVKHVRILLMTIVSLLVASVVSFAGVIAFVGLVAPHIAYVTVGRDNRFLLPTSALLGSLLLLGADGVARIINAHINTITFLIGVPLFIYLLIKIVIHSSET